ncbi:MAG: hypothetical protein H0V86_07575 [Chloroflexia bacterium]|nr:hypothetical protein [Chloroflexia bacterium]
MGVEDGLKALEAPRHIVQARFQVLQGGDIPVGTGCGGGRKELPRGPGGVLRELLGEVAGVAVSARMPQALTASIAPTNSSTDALSTLVGF